MTLEQCYNTLNGNYEEAKQRLMTDKLIEKFLLRFPSDPTMQELREAVQTGNHDAAFRAAHTLKGVAANLAFTELRQDASELTEQLRAGDAPADPALVNKLECSYGTVINTITAYLGEL